MTVAALLLIFVVSGSLTPLAASVAMLLVLAVALFIPRSNSLLIQSQDDAALLYKIREQAITRFADTLGDPCFLLNGRAVVLHRNPAAAAQFASTLVGNPLAFSLRHPLLLSAIEKVRSTGAAQSVEINLTVPNPTWFKVEITPLGLEGEAPARDTSALMVVTLHNLTEQKRIESLRSDFIANVSHELRTPLTSLMGFIETLQGPAARDAKAREKFLGIMRTQSERMSVLIDDLLSLSRIEQRQHVKPKDNVDISALLREVIEGLDNKAGEAGLDIRLENPKGPANVTGDREELYEVFENLIDNAIKYGEGGAHIDIKLVPSKRQGFAWCVNVVDHGAGIPAEHVPRLTERFYRVDAESSRKKKGTGLGLAIVKHILNRHNGQMTIRSEPDKGTDVEILLKG